MMTSESQDMTFVKGEFFFLLYWGGEGEGACLLLKQIVSTPNDDNPAKIQSMSTRQLAIS